MKVTPFGEINIKKHRKIEGKVKTLSLKCESSSKWYAIFWAEREIKPKINHGKMVGIDLGLKTFATLSNGQKIENPRHFKKYEDKLAILQQKLSHKRKGSNNKKRLKEKLV